MMSATQLVPGKYAPVNGLQLYYEVHGSGLPLVLIHGGGSTITSTFGCLLPELSKANQVIAVEMQAHGRTADIDRPLSFEQDADDVACLLSLLGIGQASFFGFSNGGTTCLQVGIRHPDLVRKLVLASANFKRSGMLPGFWEGMQQASLSHMPKELQEAFLQVNPDPAALQAMFNRDCARMLAFTDISDQAIHSIKSPVLVINGDKDVVQPEHALELSRLLPMGELAILPSGHGEYLGEICSTPGARSIPALVAELVEAFLRAPLS